MNVVCLTSSTAFGGPERQMLGWRRPSRVATVARSCRSRREAAVPSSSAMAGRQGFTAEALAHDTPHLFAATRELTAWLGNLEADVLLCQGYKADLIGRVAARRAGVPVAAVLRGWTRESLKVRCYEALDRLRCSGIHATAGPSRST